MKRALFHRVTRRQLSDASALVLAGLVLFAGIAAFSPKLHKLLHHSASDPGHFCFVTLLGHHLIMAADGEVTTASIVERISFLLSELRVLFPHFDFEYPPGRGPPASFFSRAS